MTEVAKAFDNNDYIKSFEDFLQNEPVVAMAELEPFLESMTGKNTGSDFDPFYSFDGRLRSLYERGALLTFFSHLWKEAGPAKSLKSLMVLPEEQNMFFSDLVTQLMIYPFVIDKSVQEKAQASFFEWFNAGVRAGKDKKPVPVQNRPDWSDDTPNIFSFQGLSALEKDYLKLDLNNWLGNVLEKDPGLAFEFIDSFLSKSKQLNDFIVKRFEESGGINPVEQKIGWLLEKSDEQRMVRPLATYVALRSGASISRSMASVFSDFDDAFGYQADDDVCTLLDNAFGFTVGTFFGIVKKSPTSWLCRHGWISSHAVGNHRRHLFDSRVDYNIFGLFEKNYPNKQDMFAELTQRITSVYNPKISDKEHDFSHLGRDWDNLLAVLASSKPLKVLVLGKSGSGKSALIAKAIEKSGQTAITAKNPDDFDAAALTTLRQKSAIIGSPVIVLDQAENLFGRSEDAGKALMSQDAHKTTSHEIWVASDIKMIPSDAMSAFDLVVQTPTMPLNQREKLALSLFENEELAKNIAKSCSSPGEILKLFEWSDISGQKDWTSLSQKLHSTQQVTMSSISSEADMALSLYQPSQNVISFDKVVGAKSVVDQAKSLVAGFKEPERFVKMGASPPKGVLLSGPPGTGKTYLAQAIAHEAGVPLLVANSAALSKDPAMISKVFGEARRQAPCVLFLDEIDALGATSKKQDGSPPDPERQAILNRLLVEISGFENLTGVMIIGATHRPEHLDSAVTRSGRLGWNISFEMPDLESRLELWKFYTQSKPLALDLNWTRIAKVSTGLSPADIAEASNIAALKSVMEGSDVITTAHFVAAVDQVNYGVATDRKILDEELMRTAIHEAGHAVLSWNYGHEIERISVRPSNIFLGYVRTIDPEDKMSLSEQEGLERVSMLYGGLLAERLALGSQSMGASSDLAKIRNTIKTMVRSEGMSDVAVAGLDAFGASSQKVYDVEQYEEKALRTVRDATAEYLKENIVMLKSLAKLLVKERELSGEEFAQWVAKSGFVPKPIDLTQVSPINLDTPPRPSASGSSDGVSAAGDLITSLDVAARQQTGSPPPPTMRSTAPKA